MSQLPTQHQQLRNRAGASSSSSSANNVATDLGASMESVGPSKDKAIRTADFFESLLLTIRHIGRGFTDAFAWPTALITIYGSRTIQIAALKCLGLNVILFTGSVLGFEYIFMPTVTSAISSLFGSTPPPSAAAVAAETLPPSQAFSTESNALMQFIEFRQQEMSMMYHIIMGFLSYFGSFYYVMWVYPLYAASFLLNAIWYQQIADRAFTIVYGQRVSHPQTYDWILKRITDELYRFLLLLNYVLLVVLVNAIPNYGFYLSFFWYNWIVSFLCFEYKWVSRGWTLDKRIDYFQRHWAYFTGFATPCTLIAYVFPQFISYGIFAFMFPMYIIMANRASPTARGQDQIVLSVIPNKIPIFALPSKASNLILLCLVGRVKPRPPPPVTSSVAGKK